MRGLDWRLCDRRGNAICDLDQRSGGEVEIALNGSRNARVTASLEEDVARYAQAFATTIKVWLNGAIIFNGPVNLPRWLGGERVVELAAVCPSERLARSYLKGFAKQTQIDQSEILGRIIDNLNAVSTFFGVSDGFGIQRGTLPASTLRDRYYPDGTEAWAAFTQMSEITNGPDFELEPLDRTDGVMAQLNTFLPYQGTDKTADVVFAFNTQENNAAEFVYEPGGGEIVNYVVFGGQAIEGQAAPAWAARHPASMTAHGIYQHFESLPDVKYTAQLQEYAETLVATRAYPVDFFDLTPAVEAGGTAHGYVREGDAWNLRDAEFAIPPRFGPPAAGGQYWIGDEIRAIGRSEGIDRNVVGRVTTAKLSEVGEHSEMLAVELTCAPRINAAGVVGSATTISVEDFS